MKLDLDRFDRTLAQGERWMLNDGRGLTLACTQGCVWITQHHDQRDVVLKAGERFVLDRDGTACITSFEPSHIVATSKAPAGMRHLLFWPTWMQLLGKAL